MSRRKHRSVLARDEEQFEAGRSAGKSWQRRPFIIYGFYPASCPLALLVLPLRRCNGKDNQQRGEQQRSLRWWLSLAPEVFASDMAAFKMYWHRESQKLEDVCRQAKKMPELFFTSRRALASSWPHVGARRMEISPAPGSTAAGRPERIEEAADHLDRTHSQRSTSTHSQIGDRRRRCTSCLWHREDPTLGDEIWVPKERNHPHPRHMDVNRSSLLELKPHDSMLDVRDALSSSMDSTLLLVCLLCFVFLNLTCFGAVLSLLASCCICWRRSLYWFRRMHWFKDPKFFLPCRWHISDGKYNYYI